jgi:phosphopantothenoylcysteine synthetase/decarboxylase
MSQSSKPILYIIACGGRPAADLPAFVQRAQRTGWDVCVIATPSGMKFLDARGLAHLTGHPVRSDYKKPEEPDVLPPPDAFVVAPATFNTVNKFAAGISDTLALGLLNEALGGDLPIVMVPFPNRMLARHPAFTASVSSLRSWGVHLLFEPDADWLPRPNQGESGNALFPWQRLADELDKTITTPRTARRDTALDDTGER